MTHGRQTVAILLNIQQPSHSPVGLQDPMDFTPGTFNFNNPVHPQTHPQTTLAKQLALAVVLYSPLQMASDMIENYENNRLSTLLRPARRTGPRP